MSFIGHSVERLNVQIIDTVGFAAACVALMIAVGSVKPAIAQQAPAPGSTRPQAQTGPSMDSEMIQRGMERERAGRGMTGSGIADIGVQPMMMSSGAGHTEGRLAFIKAELKITEAQLPQWDAFAETVRANAAAMADVNRSMALDSRTRNSLPERLNLEGKLLSVHSAASKKSQEALIKLYEVLSIEQRRLADGIVLGLMGIPMGMK